MEQATPPKLHLSLPHNNDVDADLSKTLNELDLSSASNDVVSLPMLHLHNKRSAHLLTVEGNYLIFLFET
jgi:hypothetical protein